MDKQQLLEFVQSLPDDLQVMPLACEEVDRREHEWESQHRSTHLGGVYQRNVDNTITLRLSFRTREQGEFLRTYTDPDGTFRNLRQVPYLGVKA